MTSLVIDIGNSQTKAAVFSGNDLVWHTRANSFPNDIFSDAINRYKPARAIVSSVTKEDGLINGLSIPIVKFDNKMVRFVNNNYATPHTLGKDRLAVVAAAVKDFPGVATLIIDAGTCITYDFVDAERNYYGGSISPGLKMRYKALHQFTANLPDLDIDTAFNKPYGDSTANAVRSGVQNGVYYEAEGFMKSYFAKAQSANIVLTGGDANFLHTVLKNSIFAPYIKNDPYLVLRGLNAVLSAHK